MLLQDIGASLLLQAALSIAFVVPNLDGELKTKDFSVQTGFSSIIRLECTRCPGEGRNDLLFNFNIDASYPTSMSLNSLTIFPLINPMAIKLQAPMISQDTSTFDYLLNPDAFEKVDIGYSLMFTDSKRFFPTASKTHSIEFQILSVTRQPINIKGIALGVSEDIENGNLVITSTRIMPLCEKCPTYECLLNKMTNKIRTSSHSVKSLPECGDPHGSTGHGFRYIPPLHRFNHGQEHLHHRHPSHTPHHDVRHRQSFIERPFKQTYSPLFTGLCTGILFTTFLLPTVYGTWIAMRRIKKSWANGEIGEGLEVDEKMKEVRNLPGDT